MAPPKTIPLRSPRESLDGYILLPRLIDKVRLFAKGELPQAYAANLLGADYTLDGRFRAFTGLKAEALRQAIMSSRTDEEVLAWVQNHAKPATTLETRAWRNRLIAIDPTQHSRTIGGVCIRTSRRRSTSIQSVSWISSI